jgi:hypothetical protein
VKEHEGTNCKLASKYGVLTQENIRDLMQLPCIFAYESIVDKDARLGHITRILKRGRDIRIEYELLESQRISDEKLQSLKWELGIEDWEFSRIHWAVKEEDVITVLTGAGFSLAGAAPQPLVNIHEHFFDVALSFPGELREYVEQVALHLRRLLGPNRVFYDSYYKSQLAIPNLDSALQGLYKDRSRLIVAFLSKDYAVKKWCGIEFRAIRTIINAREDLRVMFVRHDSATVEGVFSHDGYIDGKTHSELQVATMIRERVGLLGEGKQGSLQDHTERV